MTLRIQTNPVFAHLTRRSAWPSLRLMIALTIGLGLVNAFLVAYAQGSILDAVILQLTNLFWLLAPPVTALITVIMTGRYLRSDAYTALWLTPLAPGVIARGLILSALYRVRLVLALMIVLIPGLAVHFYSGSLASARDGCYVFLSPSAYHEVESRAAYPLANRDACVGPSDPRLVLASLAYWLPMAVACWGVALLAVIAGVAVSLARPRVLGAVLFSLAILVAAVLIVALTGRFLGAVQACLAQRTASCTTFDVWPPQNMLSNSLLAVIKKVNPRLCGGDSHSLTNPERCRTSSA